MAMKSYPSSFLLTMLSIFAAMALVLHQVDAAPPVADPWNRATMSVRIRNELSGVLAVHCKSRDDDLGWHYLPSWGTAYYFSFKSNFWGSTLFYCTFNYGPVLWNSFVVWTGPGLFGHTKMPCKQCLWVARTDAFYRAQEGPDFPIAIHPWRSDKQS